METKSSVQGLQSSPTRGFDYGKEGEKRNSQGMPENLATWQPTGLERKRMVEMSYDLETGNTNLNTPFLELDNRTLQMAFFDFYRAFIGFTQTHASNDPESAWQSYLHKPYIANKSQVMIAHAISNMAYPYFFARDSNNETAELESEVIQALSDIVFDDTEYVMKMVRSVTAVCYMPYVIVKKTYDGKKHRLKIVDMTTFKFANFYESDIQNQRFVVEDELIDFWEANSLYENKENWKYVKPGADVFFDQNSQMFLYRSDGYALKNLVRRRTYYNKALDLQLITINGVLISDPNDKIKRIGKQHERAYPFATLVFENFGRETIAGKCLAQKLWSDERLASRLQSATYDMVRQAVTPTIVSYGSENMTAAIFAPGTVINAGNNLNFKTERVLPETDLGAAYNMLGYIDKLADDSSAQDAMRGGQTGSGSTAREVVIAAQNAEIVSLGTFVKNFEKFVRDIGLLTMDDIFQFDLVKDIDHVTQKIEWKSSLILKSKDKNQSLLIRLADNNFTDEKEKLMAEVKLADEAEAKGYRTIYQINPELYKDRIFYDCQCSVQHSATKNKEIQKALALEYHQMMVQNPTYNMYEGSKEVTKFFYPDRVNDLINKPEQPQMGQMPNPAQMSGAKNPMTKQMLNNVTNNIPVPTQ